MKKTLVLIWLYMCVAAVSFRLGLGFGSWIKYTAIIWVPVLIYIVLYAAAYVVDKWHRRNYLSKL